QARQDAGQRDGVRLPGGEERRPGGREHPPEHGFPPAARARGQPADGDLAAPGRPRLRRQGDAARGRGRLAARSSLGAVLRRPSPDLEAARQPARGLRRDLEAEEGLAGTARAARRPHGPAGPAGTGTAGRSRVPQVAVVTGGSSGIGAAVARKLTERGWSCVLVARGEERLRAVAEELGAEWERCDVGDRSEVERVAAAIRERHPEIGLLVNGAGIPGRGGFLRAGAELIETVTRTNYLGGVWCLRAFLPALEAAAPSHLVNVVSVAGTISSGAAGPYSASKHAQLAFSRRASSPAPGDVGSGPQATRLRPLASRSQPRKSRA